MVPLSSSAGSPFFSILEVTFVRCVRLNMRAPPPPPPPPATYDRVSTARAVTRIYRIVKAITMPKFQVLRTIPC